MPKKDLEIRGPGELLGTKQTGDMGFRVAKLERDDHLLNQAHFVAAQILKDYPKNAEALLKRWLPEAPRYAVCLVIYCTPPNSCYTKHSLVSCVALYAQICIRSVWTAGNILPLHPQTVEKQELSIHVAGQYQYPLDHLIQQFKYEQQLHWQPLLSGILQQIRLPKVQAIVPMPISTQRLAERGYNQSMILAKDLAKQFNVPIWQPVIRLHQHSQKGLSRLERLDKIHQQFKIDSQQRQYVKLYRRVLILDDVVTTGSSIQALTLQLEQLGCHKVSAACIAYALE